MARPKKASAVLTSLDECTAAMRKLALPDADHAVLQGELDRAIAALKKDYEKRLGALEEKRDDLELQLRNYYMSHLAEIEMDGRRSIKLLYGTMGRRWSAPALKLLNKSWTWAAVKDLVATALGSAYLRIAEPELDKEKLKTELSEEQLTAVGLKIDQTETFYVEIDRTPEAEG
jgi:phage host-nuclease inhibitor protein Gam